MKDLATRSTLFLGIRRFDILLAELKVIPICNLWLEITYSLAKSV